jgi:hypothetical protein
VIPNYLATASRNWQRLGSNLSPREFEIFQLSARRRIDALLRLESSRSNEARQLRGDLERLRTQVDKVKFSLRTLADHERAKLSDHMVTNYCTVQTLPNGGEYVRWPDGAALDNITAAVQNFLKFTCVRVKRQRPAWKAFQLLDKRAPAIQLADQVNELVDRAKRRLKDDKTQMSSARPVTFWLWMIGHPSASKLLKCDSVARSVVRRMARRIVEERAQSRREAEKHWKRQQRCRINRTT